MKKFIVFTAVALSLSSYCQTWQHLLSSPQGGIGGSNAQGIRIIADTVYMSSKISWQVVPVDNPDTVLWRTRALITKHNLHTGELISHRIYGENNDYYTYFNGSYRGLNQMYNTADDLIYSAIVSDGSEVLPIRSDVLIIDDNLNVIHEYPVSPYLNDSLFYLYGTRLDWEGNIFAYGSRSQSSTLYEGDQPNTVLVKISPDGEELWRRSYNDSYEIQSIHLHSDGSIYLTAARWNQESIHILSKLLIKADSEGNELWRHNYGDFAVNSISFVSEDEDGNVIVAGEWNTTYIDVDSWQESWLSFMRVDSDSEGFELIEEKIYGYSIDGTHVYGMDKTQDGGYIGWGRTGVADYSVEPWVPGAVPVRRGYIIKLDENLDSLWMRTYWKHDPNDGSQTGHAYQFGDVQELEEGGFVAAGWARRMVQGQGIREDSWICRIDEYGCIEPGCHLVNVEEIVIGLENTMSAFPNPASDVVTIQFTQPEGSSLDDLLQNGEIILFDIQGREVYRTNTRSAGFGGQITIDTNQLPAGLYSAQWVSGKQWLDSTKILVTND
jgi:hypothetical protein